MYYQSRTWVDNSFYFIVILISTVLNLLTTVPVTYFLIIIDLKDKPYTLLGIILLIKYSSIIDAYLVSCGYGRSNKIIQEIIQVPGIILSIGIQIPVFIITVDQIKSGNFTIDLIVVVGTLTLDN